MATPRPGARRLRGNPTNATVEAALDGGKLSKPKLGGSSAAQDIGFGVAYALGLSYMFLGLAIVCDEFFVASLEALSEYCSLSEGVAGATFMAAGSSAPELFTSIADTFFFHSSVGVGTIVGSAVFNILVIIAASGAFAGAPLLIDWRPLVRDMFFYLVSIGMLFVFCYNPASSLTLTSPFASSPLTSSPLASPLARPANNSSMNLDSAHATPQEHGPAYGYVTKWESLAFVVWYFLYIGFMMFNDKFFALFGCMKKLDNININGSNNPHVELQDTDATTSMTAGGKTTSGGMSLTEPVSVQPGTAMELEQGITAISANNNKENMKQGKESKAVAVQNPLHLVAVTNSADVIAQVSDDSSSSTSSTGSTGSTSSTSSSNSSGSKQQKDQDQGQDQEESQTSCLMAVLEPMLSYANAPWTLAFTYTIPNCALPRWQSWFVATFAASCLWIGLLSWLLVYCATEFGKLAHINSVVMGVVFLAAGTSVPDAISSIIVAREGMGSMAVANAIGSNVFDICLGIGLPYLISTGVMGRPPVPIATEHLITNLLILVGTVVAVFTVLWMSKWRLTANVSRVLMALYVAFVAYNLIDQ